MQFAAIWYGDAVDIKEKVCEEILDAPEPDFSDTAEPHALLAEFPLPVFVTTNYDDFLTKALQQRQKDPTVASCQWYETSANDPDVAEPDLSAMRPDESKPLIYHLHGRAHTAKSIVLTENDYLEFLVKMARSRSQGGPEIVPNIIRSALADNPLLFIGYSMQDWTFRVLFHGLLRDVPGIHKRRNVSVQLPPAVNRSNQRAQERACKFLTDYFHDWHVQFFWGTANDFCRELRSRMNGSP